jgi:hypothetical protein
MFFHPLLGGCLREIESYVLIWCLQETTAGNTLLPLTWSMPSRLNIAFCSDQMLIAAFKTDTQYLMQLSHELLLQGQR